MPTTKQLREAIETLECFRNENPNCGNTNCELKNPECKWERLEAFKLAIEALEYRLEENTK